LLLFGVALRGNRDARLFLPPFAFIGFLNYWNFLSTLSSFFRLSMKVPPMPYFHLASYTADLWAVWGAIYCVTMLLFLVLRTVGIARERAQAAAELEAARTVQQVLIPEEIPTVPGFAILSVYKPAGQVGGDFFQILRTGNGGVLAVIGDVSGKGMPAAMTVSLLVGTVRTLAHYTQSPGEILAAMNQRMLARSSGGFTTCLVLRADANGRLTVANAGHISPYLAGKELALDNGLPLGLAADTTYSESTFQLPPGEQLTLLSDGVVEARSDKGELLGFERLAPLSLHSAAEIADTAKAFGQDDDITVLTLARSAAAI
jgi:serine phosphatase RsbU (regulator of sigma subunit)